MNGAEMFRDKATFMFRLYLDGSTVCVTLGDYDDVEAPTAALAVCIAALKAREAAR